MELKQVLVVSLLSLLLVSQVTTYAYSWWQAAGAAGAGAAIGAVGGAVFGPLGSLVGAGVGALAGFIGDSVGQLLSEAPVTSSNQTLWEVYAEDAYSSIYSQSVTVADNEINQVNLLQQAQEPFVVTAQKWEQVNYNINDSPTSPYEFYQLLEQTGFLSYAAKLVGGTQALWISEQSEINGVDNEISKYGYSITYNVNPNATTVPITSPTEYTVVIVIGTVMYHATSQASSTTIYSVTSQGLQQVATVSADQNGTLTSGVYEIYTTSPAYFEYIINPNQGMALIFSYNNGQYEAVSWSFGTPTEIYLEQGTTVLKSNSIPEPSSPLPLIVEQVALSMLGAAETEYSVLKTLGYTTASQIPPSYQLPTLELNTGNFSNFNSSLQAYNLYLAEYTRELLQMEQTLSNLSAEGRLTGLQSLVFNVSNPLSLYGEYGGFVVTNGTIVLPDGQTLSGMFLVQPYGGPLSLGPDGGVVGSGGAIAYQLIPLGNGEYALGTMYTLPPNTVINGKVSNPGTLYPYSNPQPATYTATANYTNPYEATASNAFSNLVNYLEQHPLVLLITIFFVLIIVVIIIRTLA